MVRDRCNVAESDVSSVLCESVGQAVSCLTNVQGRAERAGDAVNDVTGSSGEGDRDVLRTMKGTYEEGGIGELWASTAAWAVPEEAAKLGGGITEETVDH